MKSLIAINVSIIVANAFLTPLWGAFSHYLHGNVQTGGNAIGIFLIVVGICTWIAARIEQALHREEWFMVTTALLMSVCYAAYLFIDQPWQLYVIQAALGLCGAFQVPALYSLYNRYMAKSKATLHWGIWNGFYNIGMGVAALVSAFIAAHYGFHTVLIVLFVISLSSVILTLIAMPKMKAFAKHSLDNLPK